MKYCGRDFSTSEINHIHKLIAENFQANRCWLALFGFGASAWLHVGQTQDRGKLGQPWENNLPIKNIWLYPLHKCFQQLLCK
jgi:hypothetical protein